MADKNGKRRSEGELTPEEENLSGLDGALEEEGLPPLSHFESASGSGFDSSPGSLPPLGNLGFDSGLDSGGGLPPIEQLSVEEPMPTGGAIKMTPPGLGAKRPSFASSGSGFDTPGPAQTPPDAERAGTGFQDLTADSHFPASTPDIGPGLDSDMETPMFDSAFGASINDMKAKPAPQPTQAMATPMFVTPPEIPAEGSSFDDMAFGGPATGGPSFSAAGATPMPAFAPDSAADSGAYGPMTPSAMPMPVAPPPRRGNRLVRALVTLAVAMIAVVIGVGVGPTLVAKMNLSFIPNPTAVELQDANDRATKLQARIDELVKTQPDGGEKLSDQQIQDMIKKRDELNAAIATLSTQFEESNTKFNKLRNDLTMIEEDIESKNEEYVDAQEKYEELVNETSIVKARHTGLLAEVDRLTERVGELEEADARRMATKESLEHAVDRLAVVVKEGIPLTPEKYSRDVRIAAVEEFKTKTSSAKWVTPALMEEFTSLYQKEMEISTAKTYFFACVPVQDRYGSTNQKWAECLMIGNWAVYYRTLDGANIGVYECNMETGVPQYTFREEADTNVRKSLEQQIVSSRVEDFENKVKVLAEKEIIRKGDTSFQKVFDSL